ncbi:peptidoglycan-binding protein [Microvirga sp. ACRRW]|uniref:peptidoglycan-binding domain-containing protein n=1 Tax=Microvirga sp. ACRRW TaxID=2918205 RepID=UPI001EF696EE|nr:peptidoglycan-binding domain-containing protein [Microvirga sp. ACRRW]MCG7392533.1 peptidoglycan-binding protein [Microvirga sp. ACRRW]
MIVRDAFAADMDDDMELPAVVRRKASPRPQQKRSAKQAPRKAGMGERLAAQALKHPGRMAASVLLTGCAGVIAWNALVLQNVRHPAPLFTHHDPAGPVAPAPIQLSTSEQPLPPARPGSEVPEAQAMVAQEPYAPVASVEAAPSSATSAPRPAPRGAITDMIRNNGTPSAAPQRAQQAAVQSPAPAPAPSRAPTVRDPIAEMIRLGGPVPTPPANVGRPDGGDIVLAGQRALARLGYGVKVDGAMGPGTRQAIERFEQDRRLPVTGSLNARTARELSALSGIAVQ